MFHLDDSWLNSDSTLITGWSGSTFFTALNLLYHSLGADSPIALVGWMFTTVLALVAAISKWRLNHAKEKEALAEARKNEAEAEKIEKQISGDYQDLLLEQCKLEDCMYRDFYKRFSTAMSN
jgi:hypothetical protein